VVQLQVLLMCLETLVFRQWKWEGDTPVLSPAAGPLVVTILMLGFWRWAMEMEMRELGSWFLTQLQDLL